MALFEPLCGPGPQRPILLEDKARVGQKRGRDSAEDETLEIVRPYHTRLLVCGAGDRVRARNPDPLLKGCGQGDSAEDKTLEIVPYLDCLCGVRQ